MERRSKCLRKGLRKIRRRRRNGITKKKSRRNDLELDYGLNKYIIDTIATLIVADVYVLISIRKIINCSVASELTLATTQSN